MSLLSELQLKIERKDVKLAVIGLGYVGLPVGCEFARAGFEVIGIEVHSDRVNKINSGISPIEGIEPGFSELLSEVVSSGRLCATTDYQLLIDCDVVLIDVETPVDEQNVPRYYALRSALQSLGPVLKIGSLVIIESTIAPGTMDKLVLPLLSRFSGKVLNTDFFLGNCPERVMPGKLLSNLRNVSRVVGGMNPETSQAMVSLYRHIVQAELDPTDCLTTELAKTVENAYRDVQIAFANEIALICEVLGGDVWKLRELVNKSPFRNMHLPGAGVGGHCIPKDPWLLTSSVKDASIPIHLIPAARKVNDYMPLHMANLLVDTLESVNCDLTEARVLVMGFAYIENSDDTRNSPSDKLINYLRDLGVNFRIHDPYIDKYNGDLLEIAQDCDAAVVMVKHQQYLHLDLEGLKSVLRTPILIDGRHLYDPAKVKSIGFKYRGVGQGI